MMVLALLLIVTFILGMLIGAGILIIMAFHIEKKERENGNKEENSRV